MLGWPVLGRRSSLLCPGGEGPVLISLISAKHGPGVTTTTLALASRWPRRAVVVDADPLFGDMLAGAGAGRVPATASLVELMVAARTVGVVEALPAQLVRLAGEHCPLVVPGLGAPGQAAGLAWEQLAAGLASVPWADVIADCGRWGTDPTPLAMLTCSELVVLLMGSSLTSVRGAQRCVPVIRDKLARAGGVADHIVAVVVDPDQPYGQREIAEAIDVPIVGLLPHDPEAAAVWSGGVDPGRSFARSPLQHAAAQLAAQLVDLVIRRRAWIASSRSDDHTVARGAGAHGLAPLSAMPWTGPGPKSTPPANGHGPPPADQGTP